MSDDIQIIVPAISDEPLCDVLREITKAIDEIDDSRVAHGFLGGEHGYGAKWQSETFVMRPYYWGDCTCGADERGETWWKTNPHRDNCYQSELKAAQMAAGIHYSQDSSIPYDERRKKEDRIYRDLCAKHGLTYPSGCAVHCTCGVQEAACAADIGHRPDCLLELPNFVHRASGLTVSWYKYIGRDMEVSSMPADLSPILADCLRDIRSDTSRHSGDGLPAVERLTNP